MRITFPFSTTKGIRYLTRKVRIEMPNAYIVTVKGAMALIPKSDAVKGQAYQTDRLRRIGS